MGKEKNQESPGPSESPAEAEGAQVEPPATSVQAEPSVPAPPARQKKAKIKPGRKRSSTDTFRGRGGQLAVMAELLERGCNVAIPEIDVGTDVFAFLDDREEVARVQVKTARGEQYKKGEGYSAQFSIPLNQLDRPDKPELYYALAVRLEGRYEDFLVIGRARLSEHFNGPQKFGSVNGQNELVEQHY